MRRALLTSVNNGADVSTSAFETFSMNLSSRPMNHGSAIFTARRYAYAVFAVARCQSVRPFVCLSRSCIVSRRLKTYKLLSRPGCPIILVFLALSAGTRF